MRASYKPLADVAEKICKKCLKSKLSTDFHINSRMTTGLEYLCKECILDKKKVEYWNNVDHKRKLKTESHKRTYKGRETRIKPRNRYNSCKHHVKRKNVDWELSFDEFTTVAFLPCHYCGVGFQTTETGLDRKDNNIGYYK